jgi:hypothetical protein
MQMQRSWHPLVQMARSTAVVLRIQQGRCRLHPLMQATSGEAAGYAGAQAQRRIRKNAHTHAAVPCLNALQHRLHGPL